MRLQQELAEARAEIESLRDRNGSHGDEILGLQRQLAQQQYKVKCHTAEKEVICRKVAGMQEQHASRCSRLSKVGVVVC